MTTFACAWLSSLGWVSRSAPQSFCSQSLAHVFHDVVAQVCEIIFTARVHPCRAGFLPFATFFAGDFCFAAAFAGAGLGLSIGLEGDFDGDSASAAAARAAAFTVSLLAFAGWTLPAGPVLPCGVLSGLNSCSTQQWLRRAGLSRIRECTSPISAHRPTHPQNAGPTAARSFFSDSKSLSNVKKIQSGRVAISSATLLPLCSDFPVSGTRISMITSADGLSAVSASALSLVFGQQ